MQVKERHVLDAAPASPCPVDNRERRWCATNDGSYVPAACGACTHHCALSPSLQALASAALAWMSWPPMSPTHNKAKRYRLTQS